MDLNGIACLAGGDRAVQLACALRRALAVHAKVSRPDPTGAVKSTSRLSGAKPVVRRRMVSFPYNSNVSQPEELYGRAGVAVRQANPSLLAYSAIK